MAQQSLWQRLIAAINAVYERRIRAASLVTEYGAGHHGHHDNHSPDQPQRLALAAHPAEADADEAVVIANVPRGTRLGSNHTHHPPADERP